MLKQPSKGFFSKDVSRNFAEFTRKYLCRNVFFGVFLWILQNLWKYLFCRNSTGQLLLIKAVPIVAKGVLANETVNYDAEIEVLCINLNQKCKLLKNKSRGKKRFQKQSFADLKLGVLKNFVNSTENICVGVSC